MRDRVSVVVPAARWRVAFLVTFAALLLIKFWLAASLAPFTDEAFYWQESRHLAWGYSDLPPMTAWLIRLGESLAGHGVLGMRWPFLLLGSVLPWLVVGFAREVFDERCGWQAGLFSLLLPLAGSLGVMAVPDVPLTVAIMLALLAFERALGSDRTRDWLWLGAAMAVAWMTHYRAAMAMLVGLLFMLGAERGRGLWRRSGFWVSMLVASVGLVPLALSNWHQHGAGVAFQLVQRNPWSFHVDALVQPLEQAIACTPVLYGLLLWVGWVSWRRRRLGGPWDLLAFVALGFIGLYFVLGLFADDLRFRAHWPLPGYLPLLAALPMLLRHPDGSPRWRGLTGLALAVAASGLAVGLGYLALASRPEGARRLASFKAFPYAFVGWREAGALVARGLQREPRAVLVADNFALAAELDFYFDGRRTVYSLDSPLNVKHGRAPQLAIWQLDEAALRRQHAGAPMLLAVEETAQRERERLLWLGTLCQRIEAPRPLGRLDMFDKRKRFALYAGRVPDGPLPAAQSDGGQQETCVIWRRSHAAGQAAL